jgi:hypothetical protein
MCNCSRLPTHVADIEYRQRGFLFLGAVLHNRHFETPDSEHFEPNLDYEKTMYLCGDCGQAWYIECLPEETTSPGFALKANDVTQPPSGDEVNAAKEYLSILAHDGFHAEKCRMADCNNHKLKGRELCHLHIPFP